MTLQIKPTVRVLEIKLETEAKAPDVFLSSTKEIMRFSHIQPVVHKDFIKKLKAVRFYDQFLLKQASDNPDVKIT